MDQPGHRAFHGHGLGGAVAGGSLGRGRLLPRALADGLAAALLMGFGSWRYRMGRLRLAGW